MTQTFTEKKEQSATWNGDPVLWQDYVKRVRLQYERTEYHKRKYLGAGLASRLTGRAWEVASSELDHHQLSKPDGAAYLLRYLESRLCKAPIPDTGQLLEDFFIRLRRPHGSSMAEWSNQVREAYRRLQRAMARQRSDQAQRDPLPGPSSELKDLREEVKRLTQAMSPPGSPTGGPEGLRSQTGQSPTAPTPITLAIRELPRKMMMSGSSAGLMRSGNSGMQNDANVDIEPGHRPMAMMAMQRTGVIKKPIQWELFDYGTQDILPPEVLGWIMLRRSGLPASSRLAILSAVNNKLDIDTMERAMRDQEEELLLSEQQRLRHDQRPQRRSFWVEEESQWGLVNDFDTEEVPEQDILWVGSHLPPDVYAVQDGDNGDHWTTYLPHGEELHWEWSEDDFYAQDAQGCFWSWSDTKTWLDVEECAESNHPEAKALQEAYAGFQERLRTFQESRALNTAKHLSRGYYPMQMIKGKSKGKGKGKGKSFGKKGPSTSKGSPPSTSSAMAVAPMGKGAGPQKPGSPSYTGCFVCGSQDHDFRQCPKRQQGQQSGKVNFVQHQVYMIEAVPETQVLTAETALMLHGEAFNVLSMEYPGHAVIDSGATESIASLEALEQIMQMRNHLHGHEPLTVHSQNMKFKFGNGQMKRAESLIELPQHVASQVVHGI